MPYRRCGAHCANNKFKIGRREVLLFCKKAAKNFFNWGQGLLAANAVRPDSKQFLRRFF
jgi:hypothetical protein